MQRLRLNATALFPVLAAFKSVYQKHRQRMLAMWKSVGTLNLRLVGVPQNADEAAQVLKVVEKGKAVQVKEEEAVVGVGVEKVRMMMTVILKATSPIVATFPSSLSQSINRTGRKYYIIALLYRVELYSLSFIHSIFSSSPVVLINHRRMLFSC
jgi:hypothetical protein